MLTVSISCENGPCLLVERSLPWQLGWSDWWHFGSLCGQDVAIAATVDQAAANNQAIRQR